ncbi:hypothetical protein NUM3379_35010 [Kineococcus sp. NUM-3379]
MGDLREARRAAEKAAKALLQRTMIGAAGELAAAAASRTAANEDVGTVQERAAEHVARAQREAEEMVAAAADRASVAATSYEEAYAAALAAGWSAAALLELGHDAPAGRRSRRGAPRPRSSGDDSGPEVTPPASGADAEPVTLSQTA